MNLARALTEAMSKIGHCSQCRDFTEEETCNICNNPRRQNSGLLCVVEMPADIQAIEQTGQFSGRYFVLMGHLSPLDGIGPKEIGLDLLQKRLVEESFHEVILATNPTVEGDATANYIAEICHQHNIKVSPYCSRDPCRWGIRNRGRYYLNPFFLRSSSDRLILCACLLPKNPVLGERLLMYCQSLINGGMVLLNAAMMML